MPETIRSIIEENLVPSDNFIYGFADLRELLSNKFAGYSYGIAIGKKLDYEIVTGLIAGPTIEYYNHYRSINSDLADLTRTIVSRLQSCGIKALAVPPTIHSGGEDYDEYMRNLTYDISHKMVATRAGLGWIGKTDLFVSPLFGPKLRLVTILLKDNPGITGKPVNKSKCGKCNICVEKCPAVSATGQLWSTSVHRDEFFNAAACKATCRRLAREMLQVNESICGLCVAVCPVGNRNILKK